MRSPDEHLALADWRRQVADLYARWRTDSISDAERATAQFRAARDRLFREHAQSPLPADEREAYAGVPYWPYDAAYRLRATFEPLAEGDLTATGGGATGGELVALPSSGEEPFRFRRIGRVTLGDPLAGQSLSVFWMEGYGGGLFLPFRDATSGAESYGAGRYLLDTVKGADLGGDLAAGTLLLDFNMAYHPSCVYDPRWNCPLAPPENRLAVAVPVGERLP